MHLIRLSGLGNPASEGPAAWRANRAVLQPRQSEAIRSVIGQNNASPPTLGSGAPQAGLYAGSWERLKLMGTLANNRTRTSASNHPTVIIDEVVVCKYVGVL